MLRKYSKARTHSEIFVCLYAICLGSGLSERLTDLSATEAIKLLCQRKVSAVEYASALLGRADELECLNLYATLDAAQVLAEASEIDKKAEAGEDVRPLCGLALAVKDNIDVAGYPTEAGTPALQGMMQTKDAPLIQQLRAAHGVVLGKARMHELAEGYTSVSSYYGAVLNPYQVNMHVGGSSGGNAALVAARGAAAGFCSDTGGSCRVPASLTGVVGYRPTTVGPSGHQCYKTSSGIFPMTTSRDTAGDMPLRLAGLVARTVADVKLLDAVFSSCPRVDPEIHLEGYRIGVAREWFQDIGEETRGAFDAALEAMKKAGVELVEFDVGLMLKEQHKNAPEFFPYHYEMPREIARYLYQHKYNMTLTELIDRLDSPLIKASMEDWAYRDLEDWPNPQEYVYMLTTVTSKITQLWVDYFDNLEFDIILAPTTAITTRPIDASEPLTEINSRLENNLNIYSRTAEIDCPSAVPGLSIPIGLASDGLPIGDDGVLLSVGEALEKIVAATPPPPRRPACEGCTSRVHLHAEKADLPDSDFKYGSPEAAKEAAKELSMYEFAFEGSCEFLRQSGASEKTEL